MRRKRRKGLGVTIAPGTTAITRRQASVPARFLVALLEPPPGATVLEYGAGRGKDVQWFRSLGYAVYGYDPYQKPSAFVASEPPPPRTEYDVVTVPYVLNVIESVADRLAVLRQAWAHVRPGGVLFVSTRTPQEINYGAKRGNWIPWKDGFLTSAHERTTFQVGLDDSTLVGYVEQAGLAQIKDVWPYKRLRKEAPVSVRRRFAAGAFGGVLVQKRP